MLDGNPRTLLHPPQDGPAEKPDRSLVFAIPRSKREQLRFRVLPTGYGDARIWYRDAAGEFHPTSRGFTISPETVNDFRRAVRVLWHAMRDRGEPPPEIGGAA